MLEHNIADDIVFDYLLSMWPLDDVDIQAAIAAARILQHRASTTKDVPEA